jgi:hypothetical protein
LIVAVNSNTTPPAFEISTSSGTSPVAVIPRLPENEAHAAVGLFVPPSGCAAAIADPPVGLTTRLASNLFEVGHLELARIEPSTQIVSPAGTSISNWIVVSPVA